MPSCFALILVLGIGGSTASGQEPSRIDYTLRVDSAGLSGIDVEMRIHSAPAAFRLAMATHPEYDDQYWRYLVDLRGESSRGPVTITREDSALWRVVAPAGLGTGKRNAQAADVTIRYSVRFPSSPPMAQAAWKAHLTPLGGLVGGPHSFLYIPGSENTPVRLTLVLPSGWRVATGLDTAEAPRKYAAPNAEALIDTPIMIGRFRHWSFVIDGVPHDVAYLGASGGTAFDTTLVTSKVERIARETVRMFGQMPYRKYQFLFEDGANGGLEHLNSVSIGAQSVSLARDPNSSLGQIAHEFFHTWNEVHVRPASWIGLRHVAPAPSGELWFSEGVTLYYADLLLRRAGLRTPDSTRVAHLERMIANYLANPSHAIVSPEQTSRAFNMQAATGDYTPSMYTQGELVGMILDLMIHDGSDGRRSLDDVMRSLARRFTPAHGFTGADVEQTVHDACACDATTFFNAYVRAPGALDFDRWLGVVGLRTTVTWTAARAADGSPAPDLRVSSYLVSGESQPRLQIWFPGTVWGRAGLHTGDRLVSWNGRAIADVRQLRTAVAQLRIGDTVRVAVRRDSAIVERMVKVTGFDRPVVRIDAQPGTTERQRRLLADWDGSAWRREQRGRM
jgi:predicted metalloprotease with PDZ domain